MRSQILSDENEMICSIYFILLEQNIFNADQSIYANWDLMADRSMIDWSRVDVPSRLTSPDFQFKRDRLTVPFKQ